ncbi:SAM-dependent methyltransferase [Dactylosporangium sp. CA-139066]|uniref:SAM-dependent methyltransferase n=1 Tax=Dactylosporangium sp. CA-139066 TaxID=3239930 RepID=UPI003D92FAB8
MSDRAPAAGMGPWFSDDPMVSVPTAAGALNAIYGGFCNTTESRQLAQDLEVMWPPLRTHAFAGRAVLSRMVRYLLAAGIEQFIDVGGGVAQYGATHEIIADESTALRFPSHTPNRDDRLHRQARLVYVDIDPVTTDVNRRHICDLPWATAVVGDLLHPWTFLNHPTVNDLLDLGRPVGVLLLGVLHHLPGPSPAHAIRTIADALTIGSHLAVSHLAVDPDPRGAAAQRNAADLFARTPTPLHLRHPHAIAELLHDPRLPGMHLVEPGLVPAHHWHPDPDPDEPPTPAPHLLAAVAHLCPVPAQPGGRWGCTTVRRTATAGGSK